MCFKRGKHRGALIAIQHADFRHVGVEKTILDELVHRHLGELRGVQIGRLVGLDKFAERSARIIERFVADGNQRVTAEPGDDDILEVPTEFADLRLMQADELENYLNVSAAIKRLNEQVAAALDQFEMRYARLAGASVTPKKNPFGPEKTLRSFHAALSDVELSPQSARVLCAEMEAVALAKFPPLLQDLNQMLSAVAPSVRARPTATKTRLRSVGSIPEHMLP